MALDEAAFSGYIGQLLATQAIVDAFGSNVNRRQVNVLREEEFPLLAVWFDGDAESEGGGSDGGFAYETEYGVLVAARLGEDEAQDVVLGQLVKVVKDAADEMQVAGIEFLTGRWDADNNAAEGEGDRVWAESGVTIRHERPRGDY